MNTVNANRKKKLKYKRILRRVVEVTTYGAKNQLHVFIGTLIFHVGLMRMAPLDNRHNLGAENFDFVPISTETNQWCSNFNHRMRGGGGGDFARASIRRGENRYKFHLI